MALTDAAGDVDTTWDYDVFGAVRNLTGSQPNDFSFAGEQVDGSTGLQYLRARYYDPEVGRFLSLDPFSGSLIFPSTQHGYVYGSNSPVFLADPLGLEPGGCAESAYLDPGEGNCVPAGPGGRLKQIRNSPGADLNFKAYEAKYQEHVNRRGEFRRSDGTLRYRDSYEYRQGARYLAENDKAFRYRRGTDGRTVSYNFATNDYVVTQGDEIITYFQPTGGAGYVIREVIRTVIPFLP
jgi:RHS repeat-associated protein